MRPGINNIFLWDEQRTKKTLNENERKNLLNSYTHFEYPTVEEFLDYNFLSILNINIDNSKLKGGN